MQTVYVDNVHIDKAQWDKNIFFTMGAPMKIGFYGLRRTTDLLPVKSRL